MQTPLRVALSALVAGIIGLSSALAQPPAQAKEQPKNEAELKALEEKLQLLMKELRAQELKKAANPVPPNPPKPAPGAEPPRVVWTVMPSQSSETAIATLKELAKNRDPKIAALATELLERLAKAPPPAVIVKTPETPRKVEVVPPVKPMPPIEIKPLPPGASGRFEIAKPATSSLKMSADGKTAAVVGADGTVVVYDIASGRELMRFGSPK